MTSTDRDRGPRVPTIFVIAGKKFCDSSIRSCNQNQIPNNKNIKIHNQNLKQKTSVQQQRFHGGREKNEKSLFYTTKSTDTKDNKTQQERDTIKPTKMIKIKDEKMVTHSFRWLENRSHPDRLLEKQVIRMHPSRLVNRTPVKLRDNG